MRVSIRIFRCLREIFIIRKIKIDISRKKNFDEIERIKGVKGKFLKFCD